MQLPLKAFWLLHKNIDRLSAENDLRLASVAIHTQDGENFQKLVEDLRKQMGEIVIMDEARKAIEEATYDREGLLSLKGLGKVR